MCLYHVFLILNGKIRNQVKSVLHTKLLGLVGLLFIVTGMIITGMIGLMQ